MLGRIYVTVCLCLSINKHKSTHWHHGSNNGITHWGIKLQKMVSLLEKSRIIQRIENRKFSTFIHLRSAVIIDSAVYHVNHRKNQRIYWKKSNDFYQNLIVQNVFKFIRTFFHPIQRFQARHILTAQIVTLDVTIEVFSFWNKIFLSV